MEKKAGRMATRLAPAAANSRAWRSPSQVRRPLSPGTFQAWLPSTSSGASVAHPASAGLSGGSAPLRAHRP